MNVRVSSVQFLGLCQKILIFVGLRTENRGPGTENTQFLVSGDRKYRILVTGRQKLSICSGRETENIDFSGQETENIEF